MSKTAAAETHVPPDNRPAIILLVLVLTAMVLLGWYAFFSAPPVAASIKPVAHPVATPAAKTVKADAAPETPATAPASKPGSASPAKAKHHPQP